MEDKHIIITGTSSGLGLGMAQYYLNEGYKVFGLARRNPAVILNSTRYIHYYVDLKNELETTKIIDIILESINSIDLIILNSGVLGPIDFFDKISIEESKEVLDINLWANKIIIDKISNSDITCKQVVAISSGASQNGSAGWGAYSISKASLNMLIKIYSSENTDIHFASIAPGLVDTQMQEEISKMKNENNFEAINRIQDARGSDSMPSANTIAKPLAKMIENIYKNETSGQFFDIRKYNIM